MDDARLKEDPLPNAARDEILVAGLLVPLATTNLRAPLREMLSISDASEFGGSAGEASHFIAATDPKIQKLTLERDMTLLEEGAVTSRKAEGEQPLPALPLTTATRGHHPVNPGGGQRCGMELTRKQT